MFSPGLHSKCADRADAGFRILIPRPLMNTPNFHVPTQPGSPNTHSPPPIRRHTQETVQGACSGPAGGSEIQCLRLRADKTEEGVRGASTQPQKLPSARPANTILCFVRTPE